MKTKTLSIFNIKHAALGIAVAGLLLSATFMPVHKAQASVTSDLLAQIQQLMQVVLALQAQVEALGDNENKADLEGGFTSKGVTVGSRVKTTDTLKVRAAAGSSENWVNNVAANTSGKVINGPRYANGYTWWHVTYDTGTSGWSAENWLKITEAPVHEVVYEEDSIAGITFIRSKAFVETTDNSGAQWGKFVVDFKLTAKEEDIWIKNSLYRTDENHSTTNQAKYGQNPKFTIFKNGVAISGFGEHYTFMQPGFLSSADYAKSVTSEKNENYYVIKKGETEKFSVSVMFAVKESDQYHIQFEGPLPVQTASGIISDVDFDESLFVSPRLSLLSKSSGKDVSDDLTVRVETNESVLEYGEKLKILWSQEGEVPKGSKACVTLRRKTDEKLFAFPASGGTCLSIAGEEPSRSVTGEIIRTSGYDLTPGDYRAIVTLSGPSVGGKFGGVLATAKSAYITIGMEKNEPEIDAFTAILDGRSDQYSPYLFFQWKTSGVSACSIFMNDRVLMTNLATDGSKLLSRNTANEDYGVDFKKVNKFELRCQSAYTEKDSTVSEFKNVTMDSNFVESLTAEYKGYMNDNLFITTQDISKIDAYENCELNAENNPEAEVRCTWGSNTIYQNYGKG